MAIRNTRTRRGGRRYGYGSGWVPLPVLEGAFRISTTGPLHPDSERTRRGLGLICSPSYREQNSTAVLWLSSPRMTSLFWLPIRGMHLKTAVTQRGKGMCRCSSA